MFFINQKCYKNYAWFLPLTLGIKIGIKIDSNLNFKEHIESLCKKVSKETNAS